jgi:Mycothiol maleylpyruvate isomerase N-terminal domain
MDQSYVGRNHEQRERLRRLLEGVDEAALARPVRAGWSVATVLAHLAFWDRFGLARWDAFERTGQFPGAVDADVLNAACEAEWRALAPRAAARLALEAMEALDAHIERLSSASVEAAQAAGRGVLLDRSGHRREHLDQIEPVLTESPGRHPT